MSQRTHEQSRWELVSLGLVALVVSVVGTVLITWAATVPLEDPRNEPQVAVTEYAKES